MHDILLLARIDLLPFDMQLGSSKTGSVWTCQLLGTGVRSGTGSFSTPCPVKGRWEALSAHVSSEDG